MLVRGTDILMSRMHLNTCLLLRNQMLMIKETALNITPVILSLPNSGALLTGRDRFVTEAL